MSVDNFLDLLQRSRLVDRDAVDRVLARLREQDEDRTKSDTRFVAGELVSAGVLTRWQSERLLEGRYKGFFLKKYRLLSHLGTGGMSNVYLAEHVLMQRRVAIKVLPKHRIQDTSYLARFHREAQAAAALDHPNIVRAYDVDNEGDIHYLVMEYVDGQDLQAMVRQHGPLKYSVAADYIQQAAAGLDHAHTAGLIHRDIKPGNLLVDRNNIVKVLDLGLARFTGEDHASLTLAHDENVLGTADYLAPEQARDSHHVDGRADIYSLGCTFYFVLTGRPPFPDGTLPQRLMQHQNSPPPSICRQRPDAPKDLVRICMKMMAKLPVNRYQSAGEVADELAQWMRSQGISGGTGGSWRRLVAVAAPLETSRGAAPDPGKRSGSGGSGDRLVARGSGGGSRSQPEESLPCEFEFNTGDTLSNRDRGTVSGPIKPVRRPTAGGSSSSKTRRKSLPIARRLDDGDSLPDFLAQADLPLISRLCPRTSPKEKEEAAPSAKKRLSHVPRWLWVVIGIGSLAALGLLAALFGT